MSCVQKKLTMQVHVYTYTYSLNYFIISIVVPHGFQYIILENDCMFLFLPPASPYWITAPRNLVLSPGEDGTLICRANGNPKPSISWLTNGVPIASKMSNYLAGGLIRKYKKC